MNEVNSGNRQVESADFVPPPRGDKPGWQFRPIWVGGIFILALVAYVLFFLGTAVSLRVNVQPDNADLQLSGGFYVPLGDRFLLRPGSYQLQIQAPGYHSHNQTLSLSNSEDMGVQLDPLPGTLRLEVAPEAIDQLEVRMNGRTFNGGNPLEIPQLEPGTYELEIDAPLYAATRIESRIRGRELTDVVQLSLEPAWAAVALRSQPSGATVTRSDGETLGETPLEVRLEEGSQDLVFSAPGYQTAMLELSVMRDQTMRPEPVVLMLEESRLSLSSSPTGAAVIINGEYRGETPLDINLLPERDYQVRLFKAGYAARERTLQLDRGENRELNETLPQVTGRLAVNVTPADAQVWVDGELRATGSTELQLSTVNHRIEVRKSGYQAQSRTFLPVQNQRQVLSFELLTEEEAVWASIPQRYSFAGHQMRLFRDPGRVELGSSRREADRRANEVQWTAELDRAFYASVHEVTNQQFRRFKPDHNSGNFARMSLDGSDQPVVGITWQDAALYCNWLSEQAGLQPFYQTVEGFVSGVNPESTGYRLLTEAEWAWLASMTASDLRRRYAWGDEPEPRPVENFAGQEIASQLNFTLEIEDNFPVTAPVGSFPPNNKGLHDIGGNVAEYVHDWYAADVSTDQVVVDPLGPDVGEYHVIRGGSWSRGYLPQLRLAYRDYDALGRNDVGFRIARYAR